MHARGSWLLLGLSLAGCPSRTTVEPPPPTRSPSSPDAGSEPTSAPSATGPVAELVGARTTGESMPAALVTLRFRNPTSGAVVIEAYAIDWPGGRFVAEPADLRLAAGAEVERTARIDMTHGDVGALLRRTTEASATVTRHSPGR